MKVVVFRTGNLGDTVCAIPAFRLLRQHFRQSVLTLLCDEAGEGNVSSGKVAAMLGIFDQIEIYRSGRRLANLLLLASRIRRMKPDVVILLPQERETIAGVFKRKCFFKLCGVRDVRGACFPGQRHSWQPNEPVRLLHVLEAVGVKGEKQDYGIPIDTAAHTRVCMKLFAVGVEPQRPFLVFCGGGKSPTQRWQLSRYAEVLRIISEDLRLPVVGIGNPAELASYHRIVVPVFAGLRLLQSLELSEMFELLRLAVSYFGNDTGPMHVAAAVGTPVAVVMNSRALAGAWDPDVEPRLIFRHRTECEGCFLSECVHEGHRCMSAMSAESVIKRLIPFLRTQLLTRKNGRCTESVEVIN